MNFGLCFLSKSTEFYCISLLRVEQEYSSLEDKIAANNDVFLMTKKIVGKPRFKPRVVEVCESVLNQMTLVIFFWNRYLFNFFKATS